MEYNGYSSLFLRWFFLKKCLFLIFSINTAVDGSPSMTPLLHYRICSHNLWPICSFFHHKKLPDFSHLLCKWKHFLFALRHWESHQSLGPSAHQFVHLLITHFWLLVRDLLLLLCSCYAHRPAHKHIIIHFIGIWYI